MKRIVILCDGTWNRADSATPTNVVQLAQALAPTDDQGRAQVPVYIRGVGTGAGVTALSRSLDRVLGGAFGWGLLENIEEAYRHLVFLYEPGDELYIFGFSRGAYTARSLTGFLRSTGIVDRSGLHHSPAAIARYRTLDDPRTHPGSDESHAWRAQVSPRVATSAKEVEWRQQVGLPEARQLSVAFLGVWDSVGALGVPVTIPLLGAWASRRYRFHDAALSSMVRMARHAVALDERRPSFAPTRWSNVADLNAAAPDPAIRPYREAFFAGDHGAVGGGGEIHDLSAIALGWMIEGAQQAGLCFLPGPLTQIAAQANPLGPLRNTAAPLRGVIDWLTRLRPRDRQGPGAVDDLHPAALTRWRQDLTYRPGSLKALEHALAGTPPGT